VGAEEKGHHSMKWDGKDKNNFNLSSGIYFIELKTSFGHTQIIKTVLLK
jgi:flagellar hook assembly protein FlgD